MKEPAAQDGSLLRSVSDGVVERHGQLGRLGLPAAHCARYSLAIQHATAKFFDVVLGQGEDSRAAFLWQVHHCSGVPEQPQLAA